MKKSLLILAAIFGLLMPSCIIVTDAPGPNGYSGRAYFGISYDVYEPYSYWDNNPDIPENPYFDEYYRTYSGEYEFEYFVNRDDYWYGTYEIWVNPGEPGRPNGIAGRNGMDTYLMLVCNPDGPYESRKAGHENIATTTLADGSIQYTVTNADGWMKVTMKKTNQFSRPAHQPKANFKQ